MDERLNRTPSPPPSKEPPRRPKPKRLTSRTEWDTPTRKEVNDRRFRLPCEPVSYISWFMDIPQQTVSDIYQRDEDLLRTARPNRANKYNISREEVLAIKEEMDGQWGVGSMTTEELIEY